MGLPGALLPWLRKYPEMADLARYLTDKEELQKTSLPKGRCQHTAGAINTSEFVSTEMERSLLAFLQPLATLHGVKLSGGSDLSLRGKGE